MKCTFLFVVALGFAPLASYGQFTDPANLAAQIKNIAEFRNMVEQASQQIKIAEDMRDALKRAKKLRDSDLKRWRAMRDRLTAKHNIAPALDRMRTRTGAYEKYKDPTSGETRMVSYRMTGKDFAGAFPMHTVSENPVSDAKKQDEMFMRTITQYMENIEQHEDDLRNSSVLLDELSNQMNHASDSVRFALQTEVMILQAERENHSAQLSIAKSNLEAALAAREISARSSDLEANAQTMETLRKIGDLE